MPISVVIPAHNEEAVIGRCLSALLGPNPDDQIRIWVVANGCTDRTAEIARSFGGPVTVIETEAPSKTNALNLGDEAAEGFPRFYIDGDVILDRESVFKIAEVLKQPGVLAAGPLPHTDCTGRPWTVRAFYDVWSRLPYCQTGNGAGVQAVNEEGRKRFGKFPQITADDSFIRLQFAPPEGRAVTDCYSTVSPPTSLAKIIDIKTRSHFGTAELKRQFPELWRNEHVRHKGALVRLALKPQLWPAIGVYVYAKLATRARVRQRFKRGEIHKWERDDSSRQAAEGAARR